MTSWRSPVNLVRLSMTTVRAGVAAFPREDEVDRRQQVLAAEQLDDIGTVRPGPVGAVARTVAVARRGTADLGVLAAGLEPADLRVGNHLTAGLRHEHRQEV